MKLYELTQNYNEVLNMDADEETLRDTLEAIQGGINDKAENIVKLIRMLEAESSALKNEEERLYKMRVTRQNKVKSLKTYLEEQLNLIGSKKIQAGLFSVRIQKNAPSLNVVDESQLPSFYYIEQPATLDKRSLMNAIKNGAEINGVEMKQSESLRIN